MKDLSPYHLDGVNLLPYLTGSKSGLPHEYLFWRSGPNAAVRKGPWKLLLGKGLTRLYNVAKDPSESKDRAGAKPEVVEELKKAFEQWTKDKVEPMKSSRTVKTRFNGDVIVWGI